MKTASVILAAGQGTRMRSSLPKVLHPLAGRPMIWHALEAARQAVEASPVVVVGNGAAAVTGLLGENATFVHQDEQLGTGHAVQQCESRLKGHAEEILITSADMPLLTGETLSRLVKEQHQNDGPLTILTATSAQSRGFGRVLRDEKDRVQRIVEEADAGPEHIATQELNVGAYCVEAAWLWDALPRIPLSPKGEYYLTDLVGIAVADGLHVAAVELEDLIEAIGVNTRVHLAEAEAALRERINHRWMLAGVTIVDPQNTYIDVGVVIGQDTSIWPNTMLQGETRVGSDCTLGPNAILRDTQIGDRCRVLASVLERAVLENDVDVGPFGHLRKGAHLADGVHMGNYGEVKNSYLGPGVKVGHFSYLGDATIGSGTNIGAGTITCNYDGEKKNHTDIEEGVFIGSDTMLVAPLRVGKGARTGAGSVVTKDVPPKTLVVGAPARAVRKLEDRD